MQRRAFLRTGIAGAALLAVAARLPAGSARAEGAARALGASDRAVLAAIVPVMLAGALPAEAEAHRKAVASVVDGVCTVMKGTAPS